MPNRLNKKILCFVDESIADDGCSFHLGIVIISAHNAGQADKCFSDCLESSTSEIHANSLTNNYLYGLMDRFYKAEMSQKIMMLSHKNKSNRRLDSEIYARSVVSGIKIGLKRFKDEILKEKTVGNIDVIIDVNQYNDTSEFDKIMEKSRKEDGRFRGVNRVSKLDSSASRLLQLADVIAYSHKWIVAPDMNAEGLRKRFGIYTL